MTPKVVKVPVLDLWLNVERNKPHNKYVQMLLCLGPSKCRLNMLSIPEIGSMSSVGSNPVLK